MQLKHNEIAVRNDLGEIIVVKIVHKGEKGTDWGKGYDWNTAPQHHRVFVRNVDTKRKASFDFWASRANPNAEDRKGALDALYCFASDASAAQEGDFRWFCQCFGYDEDSITALKTFKGCSAEYDKFCRVIGADSINDFMSFGDKSVDEFISEGKVLTEY